jgi:fructoselysine-6-P-deglycase FrlB-like protein
VISQSGETADTLAAQREAKQKGSKTLAICNVVGSMITREAAGTLITHAGPEIGVASTKAFTCQLTALFMIAMYLGQVRERWTKNRAAGAGAAAHAGQARGTVLCGATRFTRTWRARRCSAPPIFCTWDAAFISPSRSKAR